MSAPPAPVAGALPVATPSALGETYTITLNLDGAVKVDMGL